MDRGFIVAGDTKNYSARNRGVLLIKTDVYGDIPDCVAIVAASPAIDSPDPDLTSPTVSTTSPSVTTNSHAPGIAFQFPETAIVCCGIRNIFLPVVVE